MSDTLSRDEECAHTVVMSSDGPSGRCEERGASSKPAAPQRSARRGSKLRDEEDDDEYDLDGPPVISAVQFKPAGRPKSKRGGSKSSWESVPTDDGDNVDTVAEPRYCTRAFLVSSALLLITLGLYGASPIALDPGTDAHSALHSSGLAPSPSSGLAVAPLVQQQPSPSPSPPTLSPPPSSPPPLPSPPPPSPAPPPPTPMPPPSPHPPPPPLPASPVCTPPDMDRFGAASKGACCDTMCKEPREESDPAITKFPTIMMCRAEYRQLHSNTCA